MGKIILTAIGNQTLKNELEKNGFDVYLQDMQYQEAVIEVLKRNKKIKTLFLNSIIPGELNIFEFINKILKINSKIKIIIILEKENETIKNFLNSKNIFDIFYNNKIKINELINLIKNDNKKEKINYKINIKNKIRNLIINFNKIINNKNNNKNKNKIINIIGSPGCGKTIFVSLLSLQLNSKKILIIDLDENKNINKILNLKNKNKLFNEIKFKNNIYILNLNKKICTNKEAEKIFLEKKEKYEKIIIDSSNNDFEEIEKYADIHIFLIEPNLIEINKSKKIIDEYIYKLNIQKNKIKIIFNKFNFYSIDFYLLKNIFSEFNILGKINLNNKLNYFINKKLKIINGTTKKEIKNIIEKI